MLAESEEEDQRAERYARGVGLARREHPQVPAARAASATHHRPRAAERDDVEQRQPGDRDLGARARPHDEQPISAIRASVGPSRP